MRRGGKAGESVSERKQTRVSKLKKERKKKNKKEIKTDTAKKE